MKSSPTMTAATNSKPTRKIRMAARAPRPLPAWLQVGMVVLLFVQGVQTAAHWYFASTAPSNQLSRFEYVYQPDRLNSATPQTRNAYDPYARYSGNMQPTFQYAGYYAHAPSTMTATSIHAYAPSTGRWVDRVKKGTGIFSVEGKKRRGEVIFDDSK